MKRTKLIFLYWLKAKVLSKQSGYEQLCGKRCSFKIFATNPDEIHRRNRQKQSQEKKKYGYQDEIKQLIRLNQEIEIHIQQTKNAFKHLKYLSKIIFEPQIIFSVF